jgi:ankyrin repeat protein
VKTRADINSTWGWEEFTPLMAASMNGRIDCVKLLIGNGADVNKQTTAQVFDTRGTYRDGNTIRGPVTSKLTPGVGDCALSLAISHGHANVVRYLLEHGATFPPRLYCWVVPDAKQGPALVRPPGSFGYVIFRGQDWTTIPAHARQTDNREIQRLIEEAGPRRSEPINDPAMDAVRKRLEERRKMEQ